MKTEKDKVRGAFLGLAIGDALGTTLEFKPPGTFTPISDMVGGGPFDLKVGEWTDDTSMALCMADSLLECREMNLADHLHRYTRWWTEGYNSVTGHCFDIGNTVRTALHNYACNKTIYAGSDRPMSAGNGSIMRLAPVALYYRKWPIEEALLQCAESSRTTHQAPECLIACRLLGYLMIRAINHTGSIEELLHISEQDWSIIDPTDAGPKLRAIAQGSYRDKEPPQIRGTGYVVDSLEAALWAFAHSHSFEHGALKAVNLGDDADTTGAVYGQLAGAYYGYQSIPKHWRNKVAWRKQLLKIADQLYLK